MALLSDTHLDPPVDGGAMPEMPDVSAMSGMSEAELVDAIRALEDTKAKACAAQARLTRALDARVKARHADQGVPAARRGRDVPGLVAYARRESPARGSRLLGFAHALTELPSTEAALAAGVVSEWRAILIARETACLQPGHRARVDAELCAPDSDGAYRFEGWGDRRLVAQTRALVAGLDPAAVVDRRARAEADRYVSLRPAPDTMARLSVLLPVAQGVAAYATLTRAADQVRAQGDSRSRGQVMTDTLVTLITGQATAEAVPVTINLTVSDHTLLAGGHQPAWLTGYGPITADHARDLAATALAQAQTARTALRRLYVAPETGTLVAMESKTRAFPKALGLFLDLRDQTCRTPWCNAPVRHHDHITDHADGGPTSAINGQGLCEQCNHTKQAPGWRATPITGPPASTDTQHTVETTLPTGHVIRSTAPRAPTPSRVVPLMGGELYYTDLHIAIDYAA
ncbi:HNH endonuclease [Nocardioides sp. LMS-CY]|uniref:HNH endonuclease n=1 Tax=Nocardioides sp. (strain LMS-CY) TaxID=2840457 RepID=UPI001C001962|nr:HNH endonuclease signature motif containing protein [Nocardioides sp. LMS-CY]QWF20582.1 HNH endonuclease [Nocardioides sp. LMS-CY]